MQGNFYHHVGIPSSRSRKRKAEGEDALMGHMDNVGSMLRSRMEKRGDESDNIGVMEATQHRSLGPEQVFLFQKSPGPTLLR